MEFVYPSFLFALAALSIPIIIHLFNFRKYKTVKFTNVRFLKNVKEQTQSQSRLKHLLVLLSRLLALSCLVFAFAQPFIPINDNLITKGQKAISVYIDNSFSMEARASEGNLFNLAKNKALSILDAFAEGDQFQIITNDFEGKHQRLVNKKTFIDYLQDIELSPRAKEIQQVFNRQRDMLKSVDQSSRQYFHITDMQKSTYDLTEISNDSSIIHLLPVQYENPSNVYIDSVWFVSPIRKAGDKVSLNVKLVNTGNENLSNVPIHLMINGESKTPQVFSIEANSGHTVEMNYTSNEVGWIKGQVSIKDYPVGFDDDFYFSYKQAERISILHIFDDSASSAIPALFGEDGFIDYSQENLRQLNYSELQNFQFLVLDGLNSIPTGLINELKNYSINGGSIAIFPSTDMEITQYNNALRQFGIETYAGKKNLNLKVSSINLQSDLLAGVFDQEPKNISYPEVKFYYQINNLTASNKESILKLQNGDDFLNRYKLGNGKIFLFATSLNQNQGNLTNHALFVPIVYNMALLSQPNQELFYFIGNDKIGIAGQEATDSPLHIEGEEIDFIPEQRLVEGKLILDFHNRINKSGFYKLIHSGNSKAIIALNYDRRESELEMYEADELKLIAEQNGLKNFDIITESNESLSNILKNINKGIPLWKYFVLGALFFLALEVLFLRIIK